MTIDLAAGREHIALRREVPLRGDDLGAIGVLLLAAVSVHNWVSDDSIGFLVLRLAWVAAYVTAAARLVQRFGMGWLMRTFREQPALAGLLGLAFVSFGWSLAPSISLLKATSLLGTTLLGVFVGSTPPERLVRVLCWVFALVVVAGLLLAFTVPTAASDGVSVGWRGVMSHKNSFGGFAVLAAVLFLLLSWARRLRGVGWLLSGLSLWASIGAHSRTALVALGVAVLTLAALARAHAKGHPIGSSARRAALAIVAAVALVPVLMAPLADLYGEHDLVNGRAKLWDAVLTMAVDRPWTGYGYAVVWARGAQTLLPAIPITAHRSANSAHNAIMNLASELGIPAAILAGVYLYRAIANAGRLLERTQSSFALAALGLSIVLALLCFGESHLLEIHSVFWIVFVALNVAVQLDLRGDVAAGRGAA